MVPHLGLETSKKMKHSTSLEYITILVVADTASNLDVLLDYLKGFGYGVLLATDGETTLTLLEYVKPNIILLEIKLPGIDGFETCRRLKANKSTENIPVIFITGETGTVDKVRGFTVGAVDYITKPIQSEEVLVRLKTHLTIQSLQTNLKEQNALLLEEIEARERLIEELDAFAHTVAHDLKNPLGVTISYAQFLQKYTPKLSIDELQQYATQIMRNGQKMNQIIDELLLLASVRAQEVTPETVEMAPILKEVQHRLAHMIDEYQAEILVPDKWPPARGYEPWIEAVWTNYISNAIKYGGTPPRVEVGATLQPEGMVQFWVQDNGDGLNQEEQEKLFTEFTRLNQGTVEGHGLGLSIVQRILKKLGGRVEVTSPGLPGQGSLFSFYLPLVSPTSTATRKK